MKDKIKLAIECLEEVVKEDASRLKSPLHIACYNRWVGELRAYRRILKMIKEDK